RVDRVLVDGVGNGLAHRGIGHRAARTTILDGRVARAAAGALGRVDGTDIGPVRAEELVRQRRDRGDLLTEILDLRDVGVLEIGGEVDLARLVTGDHRVGVAVPLPDE